MKNNIRLFAVAALCLISQFPLAARLTLEEVKENPCKSANNYCVYPADKIKASSPVPRGFKPCYIYMFARHGSRYFIEDEELLVPMNTLAAADSVGGLSEMGKQILEKLTIIKPVAMGRLGHLTEVGKKQFYGIAGRMYDNYPSLFKGEAVIDAASTASHRVMLTMMAFSDEMIRRNPKITIYKYCDNRYPEEWGSPVGDRKYDIEGTEWGNEYRKFKDESFDYDNMAARLFTKEYFETHVIRSKSMILKLLSVVSNVQDMDLPFGKFNMYELFTAEELYAYASSGNYGAAKGYGALPVSNKNESASFRQPARYLVERAENALAGNGPAATLRFCHDSHIGPWAAALKLSGAYIDTMDFKTVINEYNIGEVVPMGANIQLVFFKNKEGKVIVKFLLCEREVTIPIPCSTEGSPYYDWDDVKEYILSI